MFVLNVHEDLVSFRSNSKGWKDGGITKKCHHLFDLSPDCGKIPSRMFTL